MKRTSIWYTGKCHRMKTRHGAKRRLLAHYSNGLDTKTMTMARDAADGLPFEKFALKQSLVVLLTPYYFKV